MGFGFNQIPIDIVTLLLAGHETKKYYLLLVDEFLRFNHVPDKEIQYGLNHTKKALERLSLIYSFSPEVLVCSDFINSEEYKKILKEIEERIKQKNLENRLLKTIPQKYQESQDLTYPINEIACVEFLRRTKGVEVKLGPSKEKIYDEIMKELNLNLDFAYIIDAYALGSREPEQVIHYIPTNRGMTNGQRLFLEDDLEKAKIKITLGPKEALLYLLKLASVAGYLLKKPYLTEEEIQSLYNPHKKDKLKKITRRLVLENILKPYKEVSEND